MPALTSYSPYETLVLFQNVARHGSDALAFQEISATLKDNQLIREGKGYDSNRFSPSALQSLYERLMHAQSEEDAKQVNGDSVAGLSNPRKRKLSASPAPENRNQADEDSILQAFVDSLYSRFRDETIKEIRRNEEEYQQIQDEIRQLEVQVQGSEQDLSETTSPVIDLHSSQVSENRQGDGAETDSTQAETTLGSSRQDQKPSVLQVSARASPLPSQSASAPTADRAQSSSASTPRNATPQPSGTTPQRRLVQPNQGPNQPAHRPSPGPYEGNMPPAPSQHPPYPPVSTQHGYIQGPHPQQAVPPMPPPVDYAAAKRTGAQGHVSPSHQASQQPYQPYPQYSPGAPQWHSPVPSQPYAHPQYGAPPYYPQPGRQQSGYHTPNQPPYQQFYHTAPVPYAGQPQWQGQVPHQYPNYPVSASATPIPRPGSRPLMVRSNSSTPWKRRAATPVKTLPSRSSVEREVSPLSDHGSPSPDNTKRSTSKRKREDLASQNRTRRGPSATPSAHGVSRSQSIVSHTSETASEKPGTRRTQMIKAELPSTPIPVASDTEQQRSSGRRGRPRNNTATSRPDVARLQPTQKRKRESIVSPSPSPAGRSSAIPQPAPNRRIPSPSDPSLVVVSKNFAKTCQLLLNEITSHKLAGIFAKPLTERDAPGYKELVFQTQDLKSVKAAVSKGSRAATTAIEEMEADGDSGGDATSTTRMSITTHGAGSIGDGFYFVKKSEDLVPPKGIVNSSQLEMELVRMFANAVMFNPLPTSERGFGRSLRLRKMGGDVLPDQDTDVSESENSEAEGTSAGEEGGIISDAREMFDDVVQLVAKWRDLEGERLTDTSATSLGGAEVSTATVARHASLSASSAMQEEEEDGGSVATPSAGPSTTGRKRRRIGDH